MITWGPSSNKPTIVACYCSVCLVATLAIRIKIGALWSSNMSRCHQNLEMPAVIPKVIYAYLCFFLAKVYHVCQRQLILWSCVLAFIPLFRTFCILSLITRWLPLVDVRQLIVVLRAPSAQRAVHEDPSCSVTVLGRHKTSPWRFDHPLPLVFSTINIHDQALLTIIGHH